MPSVPNSESSGPQPKANGTNGANTIDVEHFKRHVMQLFGKERGGHMARWVYLDVPRGGDLNSGSDLWSAFVDAAQDGRNSYYLTKEEVALIQSPGTVETLSNIFSNADRIIDFGSGNAYAVTEKAMPIVRGLKNVKVYTPFDISKGMLNGAVKAANDNLGSDSIVKIMPVHGDFSSGLSPETHNPITFNGDDGKNRVGIFLGSTMTNQEKDLDEEFPRKQFVKKLRQLALTLNNGKKGKPTGEHGLIVGYDSNLDILSASAAYIDPDVPKLWAPLVTGVMFDIKRLIDPQPWMKNGGSNGFNPQAWHHERRTETGPPLDEDDPDSPPAWIVLHQCVVADEDQDFKIENGQARRFQVKEGDIFVVKNNFKLHPDFFRQLAREAGFDPQEKIQLEGSNAVLQPLIVSY